MLNNKSEYIAASSAFHGSIPIIMGTRFDFLSIGKDEKASREIWNWICFEVERKDALLNRFAPESEVSRVNKANVMQNSTISHELADLVRLAMDYWRRTGGLFDITKGGMEEVSLDNDDRISLRGHELDFGGVAKGFILKEIKDKLLEQGVDTAFVDFGGSSIMGLGHHPFGDCWKVGVKDPFGGAILGEIELKNQSMSTSGNTPVYDGHVVNPKTGEAVVGQRVVTVVSDNPLDAEVLSTAALIANKEELEKIKLNFNKPEFYFFK